MTKKTPHRSSLLSAQVRTRIHEESKALQISDTKYLNTLTTFAKAIREALAPDGVKDSSTLLAVLDNPLLLPMVISIAKSMIDSLQTADAPASNPIKDKSQPTVLRESAPVRPSMIMIDPMTGQHITLYSP